MGLLLLARGLLERLDAAYHLSVGLLAGGIVVSLLRGFNVEEASILTLMLLALLPSRRYFDRRASLLHETLTPGWVTSIVLVFLGALWLGIFSHKHVEYSHSLWWRFALVEDAPRSLRAMVGAAVVLVAAGVARLLRPADPRAHVPDEDELTAAARIAAASPRTTAYLALTADKSLLFNDSRTAFLMYAIEGSSWVSLGDPVGTAGEASELAWRFRELCDRHAGWPVFYKVSAATLPRYPRPGLVAVEVRRGSAPHTGGFQHRRKQPPRPATGGAQGGTRGLHVRDRAPGKCRSPAVGTEASFGRMADDTTCARKRLLAGLFQ